MFQFNEFFLEMMVLSLFIFYINEFNNKLLFRLKLFFVNDMLKYYYLDYVCKIMKFVKFLKCYENFIFFYKIV